MATEEVPEQSEHATLEPLAPLTELIPPDELINKLAIPAFVINREHRITHWNLALASATGLSAGEMLGTRKQWMPFYSHPRPTMADIIVDNAEADTLSQFYSSKLTQAAKIEGAYAAEDFFPDIGDDGEWLSFTAAPLMDCDHKVVGAIETLVIITDRKKAEQQLVENERRYRELSVTDDLTQLYNARQLRREINRQIELCQRYQQPMSLAMMDLDHFKQLNDNHGHLFGDEVLRKFAEIIRHNLRHSDDGFRYGGEEFIVLMPFIDEAAALQATERIHQRFCDTPFLTPGGETIYLTVSAGITRINPDDDYDSLLRRADTALYEAKKLGRNRIIVATAPFRA
ncbi:MAG: GGDEF domain-containing protein [Oceanospirillaceae bacterium]|nr:GGDEF domain-containing protein [Oceanospirillaceae bacterium]